MIPAFLFQIVWTLSIMGLGRVVLKWLFPKYFKSPPPFEQCLIGGCFTIVFIAQIYHLFFKIDPVFSTILLVFGLYCFFQNNALRKNNLLYIFLAIASIRVAPHIINPMNTYDNSLYHIQSILWHLEAPLIKGLANIHTRLGFNSNFLIFAGVLFPFKSFPDGFPLANGVIANIVLLPLLKSLHQISKDRQISISSLYLLLSSFHFLTLLYKTSNGPGTDLPIHILAIISFYFLLQYLDRKTFDYLIIFSLTITLGLTFKLSLAPYCLFVIFFVIKHIIGDKSAKKSFLWLYSCLAVMIAFWCYRFYIMSGCWIVPIAQTCTATNEYWAVPLERISSHYDWIQSWSRVPDIEPHHKIFKNFGWFSLWFENNIYLNNRLLVAFSTLSFIYLAKRAVSKDKDIRNLRILFAMHILAIFYWFFTAPDFRFGSAYLTILSAHSASDLVFNIINRDKLKRTLTMVAGMTVIIFGLLSHLDVFSRSSLYLKKTVPNVPTINYSENNGVIFKHPVRGSQCWASPLPCTTRNKGSFHVEKKNGVITLIAKKAPQPNLNE